MSSTKKRITAALMAAILSTILTIPATAAEAPPIRVSSYKGSTLEAGERSGLIIGPSGENYSVTSSDPDTVAVEQALTFWVAVAKAEGSAEITASSSTGEHGSVTLTICSTTPAASESPDSGDSAVLTDNLGIRQEMIRLINQTRKANGVPELPVNEAPMNAAQGAVNNWINSPGHLETMIDPRCDCIGVGVTQYNGITYCYMFVGIPKVSTSMLKRIVLKEGRPGSWMALFHRVQAEKYSAFEMIFLKDYAILEKKKRGERF